MNSGIIFSDKVFDIKVTSNEELANIIASHYIEWANGDPIFQNKDGDSLWTRPTAKNILKFFSSSAELVNFGLHFIQIDDERFGPIAREIWRAFCKEPYIWGNALDFTICNEYRVYARKVDFPTTLEFLETCETLKELFSKYFYQEVVLQLRNKREEMSKPDLLWVERPKLERLEKTVKDFRIRETSYDHQISELKKRCCDYKNRAIAFTISTCCCFVFCIIFGVLFICASNKNSHNVSSEETTEQIGVTVQNTNNKDVTLDILN